MCIRDRSGVVLYRIVWSLGSQVQWKLAKRYEDFEVLHRGLFGRVSSLPYLPAKSLFKLSPEELSRRRADLEKYLRILLTKLDVLNSEEFRDFADLETRAGVTSHDPHLVADIDYLPMGVRDLLYLNEAGILFIGMAETSTLSRIGSFITTSLFRKNPSTDSSYLGAVLAYGANPKDSFAFSQLWRKNISAGVSCLCWDEGLRMLAIGTEDGSIECVTVSAEKGYRYASELCTISVHRAAVTALVFDPTTATLFSAGKDKTLFLSEVSGSGSSADERQFLVELTGLLLDRERRHVYVGDGSGMVHIYEYERGKTNFLHVLNLGDNVAVRQMTFDSGKTLLIVAGADNAIRVFNRGNYANVRLITLLTTIPTDLTVTSLTFDKVRRELYIGSAMGGLHVMAAGNSTMVYGWKAHAEAVTKVITLPEKRAMITASKDRFLKVWQLPEQWSTELIGSALAIGSLSPKKDLSPGEEDDLSWTQEKAAPFIAKTTSVSIPRSSPPEEQKSDERIERRSLPASARKALDEEEEDLGGWAE
eukprot:TRINITY_DN12080_c0_g1_i3.p1 TRINITY_DN12080_c0_g1~~TRINITY_DN12080_c0_g1_i3.p1  ORF type:complete len:554 (+),score=75.89 TRINITY_DN12080_c0_g1_i3:61-1662(+)